MGQQYRLAEEERHALQEALQAYGAKCIAWIGYLKAGRILTSMHWNTAHADPETALHTLTLAITRAYRR